MEYKVGALGAFKIIDKEKRIIGGYMGDDNVDTDGHMIDKDAYMMAIEEYLPWGNVRDAHKGAVGNVISHGGKGWNYIEVQIVDDAAWKLVENGVYKGFSVGLKPYEKTVIPFMSVAAEKMKNLPKATYKALKALGKILRIDSMLLVEISLTDRPVNQAALFAKSEGGETLEVLPSIFKMENIMDTEVKEDVTAEVDQEKKENGNSVAADVPAPEAESTPAATTTDALETPAAESQAVSDETSATVEDAVKKEVEIEKSTVNDGVVGMNGTPTANDGEQMQPDPMDSMKTYMDTCYLNLYNAIVEQMNIGFNMLGEKIISQVNALMTFVQQQAQAEDAQEPAAEAQDGAEMKSASAEVEVPVVEVLTADVVKNIVKESLAEAIGSLQPMVRKGAVNGGFQLAPQDEKATPPDYSKMSKSEILKQTALAGVQLLTAGVMQKG